MEPPGQARACTPKCHDQLFSPQKFRHAGVVPKNHTHLRLPARSPACQSFVRRAGAPAKAGQGFGGSSAGERNPPKHGRFIAEKVSIGSYAFLQGQGRGLMRRRMKNLAKITLAFGLAFNVSPPKISTF
jgi:hypothetical protein